MLRCRSILVTLKHQSDRAAALRSLDQKARRRAARRCLGALAAAAAAAKANAARQNRADRGVFASALRRVVKSLRRTARAARGPS